MLTPFEVADAHHNERVYLIACFLLRATLHTMTAVATLTRAPLPHVQAPFGQIMSEPQGLLVVRVESFHPFPPLCLSLFFTYLSEYSVVCSMFGSGGG